MAIDNVEVTVRRLGGHADRWRTYKINVDGVERDSRTRPPRSSCHQDRTSFQSPSTGAVVGRFRFRPSPVGLRVSSAGAVRWVGACSSSWPMCCSAGTTICGSGPRHEVVAA